MKKYKKEFTFDLCVDELKNVFTQQKFTKGYDQLYQFFCIKNNFEHRQGSVYCSRERLSTHDVFDIVERLRKECPWLKTCLTRMDVADVGEVHELTSLIKDYDIDSDI